MVDLNKNDFDSLTPGVYNNLNNDELKTTANNKPYDLENAKKFLVEINTQKNCEKEALELILI